MSKIQNNIVPAIMGSAIGQHAKGPKGETHLYAAIPLPRKHGVGEQPSKQSRVVLGEDGATLLCTAGGSVGAALYAAMVETLAMFIRAVVALEANEELPKGGKVSDDYRRRAVATFRNTLIKYELSEAAFIEECDEFILAAGEGRGITMVKVYPNGSDGPVYFVNLQLSNKENVETFMALFGKAEVAVKVKVGDKTAETRVKLTDFFGTWTKENEQRERAANVEKVIAKKAKLQAALAEIEALEKQTA